MERQERPPSRPGSTRTSVCPAARVTPETRARTTVMVPVLGMARGSFQLEGYLLISPGVRRLHTNGPGDWLKLVAAPGLQWDKAILDYRVGG